MSVLKRGTFGEGLKKLQQEIEEKYGKVKLWFNIIDEETGEVVEDMVWRWASFDAVVRLHRDEIDYSSMSHGDSYLSEYGGKKFRVVATKVVGKGLHIMDRGKGPAGRFVLVRLPKPEVSGNQRIVLKPLDNTLSTEGCYVLHPIGSFDSIEAIELFAHAYESHLRATEPQKQKEST